MMRSYPRCTMFGDRYYTEAKIKRQTYDLVIPDGLTGSAGLILCIHGGGWIEGDKSSYTSYLCQIAEDRGIAAASVNYRFVSDSVSFDDVLDDITSALAAIRAKGEEIGISFDRALLTGVSAGGHISLLYACTRRGEAPIKPVCVVELCGPTDLEDPFYYSEEYASSRTVGAKWYRKSIGDGTGRTIPDGDIGPARPALKKYSPINFIDGNTVPIYFGHGDRDAVVPYRNALDLDGKLTELGTEHELITFPDSGHECGDQAAKDRFFDMLFSRAERLLK